MCASFSVITNGLQNTHCLKVSKYGVTYFPVFSPNTGKYGPDKISQSFHPVTRNSRPEVFSKKSVVKGLSKFAGKQLQQYLFFNKVTLRQVFLCKFCEIFKNIFLYRTHVVTTSETLTLLNGIPLSDFRIPYVYCQFLL